MLQECDISSGTFCLLGHSHLPATAPLQSSALSIYEQANVQQNKVLDIVDKVSAAISPKAAAGLRSRNQYFKSTGTQRPKPIEREREGRGWHTCMHACMNARVHEGIDKNNKHNNMRAQACELARHLCVHG